MTAGASIEDRLQALEDALAAQQRVTLRTVQAGVYLGQAVTVTASVTNSVSAEPLAGVPVTLVTPWGVLRGGDDLEEGGSMTALTGADGQVRVVLRPKLSLTSDEQQDAMEAMLAQMSADAATPADAAAGLQELALQYRWEANGPFRAAVDVYIREFGQRALQTTGWRDSLPAWPLIPAAVVAYSGNGQDGGAGAAAVLTVQFRNWLGPWMLAYQQLLESQSTLKAEILKVKKRSPSPAGLLAGVFNRASLAVDSEFGEIGSRLAKKSAEAVIGDFLDNEVSDLPPATRTAIGPALQVGARAFASAGASVISTLGQTQASTAGATASLAGKADLTEVESLRTTTTKALDSKLEATAFEGFRKQVNDTLGTKFDRAELGPALAVKADVAALETLRTTTTEALAVKADTSALDKLRTTTAKALDSKLESTAFEGFRKQVNDRLGTKFETADLAPALAVKADAAALEGFRKQMSDTLGTKLDRTELGPALALKADSAALTTFQTSVNTVLAAKVDRTSFEQFNSTLQGRLKIIEVKLPR